MLLYLFAFLQNATLVALLLHIGYTFTLPLFPRGHSLLFFLFWQRERAQFQYLPWCGFRADKRCYSLLSFAPVLTTATTSASCFFFGPFSLCHPLVFCTLPCRDLS